MGKIDFNLSEKAQKSKVYSRSLYVVKDIVAGEILSEDNIRSIRPGFGLHPKYYNEIIGKKALVDLKKGMALSIDHVS